MAGDVKLTSREIRILSAVDGHSRDIFDLSDHLGRNSSRTYHDCVALRERGLIDWMYVEDEMVLNNAGRAALRSQP